MPMKICLGNNYKVHSQQSLYPNIHSNLFQDIKNVRLFILQSQLPIYTSKSAPRPKTLTPTLTPRPESPLTIPRDYKPKKIPGSFDDKYTEYESEGSEGLSIEQYLDTIWPYLGDIIDDLRTLRK